MPERMFPIMTGDDIPWAMIALHEDQANTNHGQSLKRLAERGGLSCSEAIWVIRGQRWNDYGDTIDSPAILAGMVEEWRR